MNKNFLLAHRNRCSEGMDDGQKTPCGHPYFDSYVKNLCVLVFRTDGRTDGWTDIYTSFCALRLHSTPESYPVVHVERINPVWASLTTFLQVKILSVAAKSDFTVELDLAAM